MFRKIAIGAGILLGGPLGAGLGMGLANRFEFRFFVLEALGAVAGAWFGGMLVQTIIDGFRSAEDLPDKGEMSVGQWGWWAAIAMGLLGPVLMMVGLVWMIWPG